MSTLPPRLTLDWDRIQRTALLLGAICLALCVLGGFFSPEQFFRSYLVAVLFCTGISLGSMALVMLYHLTGGAWGYVIRRVLEAGSRLLPLTALLFLPVFPGMHFLYPWMRPDEAAADAALRHKHAYLNQPFFMARTVGFFLLWMGFAYYLNAWSWKQDQAAMPRLPRRFRLLSGPGLVVYGLTITFAATDWVMSLQPHWYSTIFAPLFATGQLLTALAFAVALLLLLALSRPDLNEVLSPDTLNDLGNLLLAFVMIWSYMAFSQFLLVWTGNIREEVPWYLRRTRGGWEWVAVALILFHFAIPFLFLLSRDVKRVPHRLLAVALGILLMRLVDLDWQVLPAFPGTRVYQHWMDVLAPLGVCGIWLGVFLWQLRRWPLLVRHDLSRQEAERLHALDLQEAATMVDLNHPDGQAVNPDVRHERSDVNVRGILGFAVGFILVAILIHFLLVWQFGHQRQRQARIKESQFPLAAGASGQLPPEPRLEPLDRLHGIETSDVCERLRAKEEQLESYGPSSEQGYAHIPIGRAMDILAGKLPVQTGSAETKPGPSAKPGAAPRGKTR